jgi:hypothetical protein
MNAWSSASERVIDRRDELALFNDLLGAADGPYVLAIHTRTGTGKSLLLELYEEAALPLAATARIALPKEESDAITLAESIGNAMRDGGDRLESFDRLNAARRVWRYDDFGLTPPQASVIVQNSELTNSTIAGNMLGWPDGHERVARERCLDALLDDLRELSRKRQTVLLIDQYERATDAVTSFCGRLTSSMFDEKEPFGLLVVVVACEDVKPMPFPRLSGKLRARADRFRTLTRLSTWEAHDIELWLARHGLAGHELAEQMHRLFEADMPLFLMDQVAAEMRERRGGA